VDGTVAHVNPRVVLLVFSPAALEQPMPTAVFTPKVPGQTGQPGEVRQPGTAKSGFHHIFMPSTSDCDTWGLATPFVWLFKLLMLVITSPAWWLWHAVGC
ncbi:MAG: hypothetical protein ACK4N5_15180, partial [Myxococcales bacterium]